MHNAHLLSAFSMSRTTSEPRITSVTLTLRLSSTAAASAPCWREARETV
jgi:hypothetical protein